MTAAEAPGAVACAAPAARCVAAACVGRLGRWGNQVFQYACCALVAEAQAAILATQRACVPSTKLAASSQVDLLVICWSSGTGWGNITICKLVVYFLSNELELKDNVHLIMDFSNPEHLNEKEKQITIMEQALELLNSEQKKCIDLFYLKNKSYVEIVDITGYTANEVKSHIQNGKRNLKIKMELLINEDPNK
jgi:RNA polymerase sigma factor (sigma-70 family)